MARQTRIFWQDQEKAALAQRVAEIMYLNPEFNLKSALNKAQKDVLPADRQRNLESVTKDKLDWLEASVEERIRRLKEEEEAASTQEEEAEEDHKPTLEDASIEELFIALISKIGPVVKSIAKEVALEAVAQTRGQPAEVPAKLPRTQRKRAPKVLVIGLLPKQANEIASTFKGVYTMRFLGGNPAAIRAAAGGMDLVVAHTDHLSHSAEAAARTVAKQYVRVAGGLNSLKNVLDAWAERLLS